MSVFLARLLGTAVFTASAIGHITNFKADANWLGSSIALLAKTYGFDAPAAQVTEGLLAVAIALLVLGSLLFGLGINEQLGSLFLIMFLLPVTPVMHPFWLLPAGSEKQLLQLSHFLKNTTLLGLLLLVHLRAAHRVSRHASTQKKTQ